MYFLLIPHTTAAAGITQLTGVTENRRADISPYLNKSDIDPNLGVIGVNDMNGDPLATGYIKSPHPLFYSWY